MKQLIAGVVAVFLILRSAEAAESVSFAAADGGKVYGDIYRSKEPSTATILLFHQAGSNRGEYETIAPRLEALGYNVLAIDQRAGGTLWNRPNATAEAYRGNAGYLAALPDLEGALAFATNEWPKTHVIVWGSSYSASLVFFLAARHPEEIVGLLSFSPGEYFSRASVAEQAAEVRCPVFITSAPTSDEVAAAKRLFDAVPGTRKTQFIPTSGVHGASTLRRDANPTGEAEIWSAVDHFLATLPGAPSG
jgi:pimeloyl-ACP methyl ester carboxylesterase